MNKKLKSFVIGSLVVGSLGLNSCGMNQRPNETKEQYICRQINSQVPMRVSMIKSNYSKSEIADCDCNTVNDKRLLGRKNITREMVDSLRQIVESEQKYLISDTIQYIKNPNIGSDKYKFYRNAVMPSEKAEQNKLEYMIKILSDPNHPSFNILINELEKMEEERAKLTGIKDKKIELIENRDRPNRYERKVKEKEKALNSFQWKWDQRLSEILCEYIEKPKTNDTYNYENDKLKKTKASYDEIYSPKLDSLIARQDKELDSLLDANSSIKRINRYKKRHIKENARLVNKERKVKHDNEYYDELQRIKDSYREMSSPRLQKLVARQDREIDSLTNINSSIQTISKYRKQHIKECEELVNKERAAYSSK